MVLRAAWALRKHGRLGSVRVLGVADTQRIAGILLSYMTRMGVSSAVVEAMSQTRDIRWLGVREASAMNLVTEPARQP